MRPDAGEQGGSPLSGFFLKAAACLVLCTGAWWFVADALARPAALLAQIVLETVCTDWVRYAVVKPDYFGVETKLLVDASQIPGANAPPGTVAELVVDARPSRYGYSLPLFLALLLAGSRRCFVRNALIGAACLVPFQAFSMFMDLLRQAALASGPKVSAQMGWAQWQLEAIGFGYQLGVLLIPPLLPVLLWGLLDQPFVRPLLAGAVRPQAAAPAEA